MRVVNVSKEPYEWTYDSGIYGPVAPGEVREFPDDAASHGLRKSEVLDELGNPTGVYRMVPASSVPSARLEEFAQFRCSLCNEGLFRKDELKAHMMESHFAEKGGESPRPSRK